MASNGFQVAKYDFDFRIEIWALTNLHLDIHEGILEFDF